MIGDSEAEFCTVTHHWIIGISKQKDFIRNAMECVCTVGMIVGLGDYGMTSESDKDDIRWDEGERGRRGTKKEEV